ncbi:MAG: hypothetical protein COV52_01950 [Gammaproteobacteria bacterium CG11_big_fil_rev_8_21_14_0_20_46_22]|nr:MAG: hypothetical protein COW05_05845 [Gammaproteobacteria bacterium CG12_big_fil_rev_8_21_14_0_65_46_12]PIR11878.1 MAG: hypothetical protein COV52_01950 [Gammaproteobacteria bacterium CG11_big_fil_rev_8_21_14_0_20_46_22]
MSTLFKILGITIIACLGLLFFGHVCVEHSSASKLSQVLAQYHWALSLWRYGLYTLVLIIWPYFIEFVGIRQKWRAETILYLSNQRLKLLALFAFIEIFFVYNLLGHLFVWL